MKAKAIDFLDAAQHRNRLRKEVVCSEPWVETIVAPLPEGQGWLFAPDLYPPGGSALARAQVTEPGLHIGGFDPVFSDEDDPPGRFPPVGSRYYVFRRRIYIRGMQQCRSCKRVCPPNGAGGSPCCDCQTEKKERDFLKRALHRQCRELLPDLRRLWWRSAISYADFMDRPTAGLLGGLCLEQDGEELPEAEEGSAFYADADRPTTSDERPQISNVSDPRVALQIALRRLDPPKKERGVRAPGCQIVLVPETAKRLRKEMAYYREKARIMPSARRYSRHNPYLPAREDYDSAAELSAIPASDAYAADAEEAMSWG